MAVILFSFRGCVLANFKIKEKSCVTKSIHNFYVIKNLKDSRFRVNEDVVGCVKQMSL